MDFFSHFLIGIFIAIFALSSLGEDFVILAAVMAFLPDFDIFLEFFRSIRKSKLLTHKGVSHSFFSAFIISAISGLIFSLITGLSFILAWLVGFIFYSLHVVLDGLAASKIPLFYPFSKKRFRFFIDRAINPYLALTSGIIIIFYMIVYNISPEIYYSNLTNYLLVFYLCYLAYRFLSRLWIQGRLPKNFMMIPGVLPFTYYVYENHNSDTKLSFKLTKNYQFSSKKIDILQTEIPFNSEEMEFFELAKSLSENYIFFSKWEAVMPMIWNNEYWITVLLFLAESYASGSAYSFEVVFDKKSKRVIHKSDGFGYVLDKYNEIQKKH
ncbi:MAG: metal-dependent hydrolase [Promethearchaeota archaeon]|nr:MAG: metal-dependent hydrolase [Candidatus Lokiarchaeota archaeon]